MAQGVEPEVAPTFEVRRFRGPDASWEPYRNLVFSTFLNSLRYGNHWFEQIDCAAYYKAYHRVLEQLLSRQECTVRIAVLSDDPDVALGWSLSRPKVLDYVFVKRDGRRQGIGRALLPASFAVVTHLTSLGEMLREKHFPDVKFDPFQ